MAERNDIRVRRDSNQSEVEDSDHSSDEDYSPGSLVIDTAGFGSSSSNSSTPIASSPLKQTSSAPQPPLPGLMELTSRRKRKREVEGGGEGEGEVKDEKRRKEEGGKLAVSFVGRRDAAAEGKPPVNTLTLYTYHWGDTTTLDIICRREDSLIPVRNIYENVMPGLKRNVLSARISKLGIRSLALTEPYVSTLKKIGLKVVGSSHYVTILDFIKICRYFKRPPPESLAKFCFITSQMEPEDVVKLFSGSGAQTLLTAPRVVGSPGQSSTLSSSHSYLNSLVQASSQSGSPFGLDGGSMYTTALSHNYESSTTVDARRLTLPNGSNLTLLVRDGVVYIPNPELAKLLPSITRNVMESLRSTYSITVHHANKAEIGILKNLGILGVKAGRSLVYRAADVAKMFDHWHSPVPDYLRELCEGKLPEEKIDPQLPPSHPHPSQSHPHPSPSHPPPSSTPQPYITTTPTPTSLATATQIQQVEEAIKMATTHEFAPAMPQQAAQQMLSPQNFPPNVTQSLPNFAPNLSDISTPYSSLRATLKMSEPQIFPPSRYQYTRPILPAYSGAQGVVYTNVSGSFAAGGDRYTTCTSPLIPQGKLTPEHFQQPVQMLNSIQQGLLVGNYGNAAPQFGVAGTGIVPRLPPSSHDFMSPSGTKLEISSVKKRRTSSSSGPSLDDEDLEYLTLIWGDQSLTMLCPSNEEPYLAVPELISKVFRYRSYMSVQRRLKLGVVSVPATSIQIHALRARGSLEAFTGNTKLISLSAVVKLAADGNLQIPGNVIQLCKRYAKEPIERILNPPMFASSHPTPTSSQPSQPSQPSQSHIPSSSHPTTSSSGITPWQLPLPRKMMPSLSSQDEVANMFYQDMKLSWNGQGPPPHPDIIALGPTFRTGDGMMCQVRWGNDKLAVHINNKRVNYMGLYQVFDVLFKRYVNRMNFKMRMRKLNIRSIRAPSSVRLKLIELNALPQTSPVCGLIRISEMEQLAKSYGVTPPDVFYDVFLSKQSGQNPLAAISTFAARPRKHATVLQSHLQPGSTSGKVRPGVTSVQGTPMFPSTMSSQSSDSTEPDTALVISIPRQLTPFKPHPSAETQHTNLPVIVPNASGTGAPLYRSFAQNLAKKITQKSRKFTTSTGPASTRCCLACTRVNPSTKKRCQFCGEFLIGRPCPKCGTLNHNRTRECFRCNSSIPYAGEGYLQVSPGPTALQSYLSPPPYPEATPTNMFEDANDTMGGASSDDSQMKSPSSPKFQAPPIRSAALKSMFPQEAQRQEDTQVVTKTMYSGNLSSSRRCLECAQLNSKMAKKCVQCRSPLQGKPCPRCGRPNLNHSLECYKCGMQLPPSASKWVYVGSHSGRAYRMQDSTSARELASRAPISCIRCHKLRSNSRLKCGRCGEVYLTKPIVDSGDEDLALSQLSAWKKRKEAKDTQENGGTVTLQGDSEDSDSPSFLHFAQNLLILDIGEQLTPILSEVEVQCREKVYPAEEEFEAIEEEYQGFLRGMMEKETEFKDTKSEMDGLFLEVERCQARLEQLTQKEEEASEIVAAYPAKISELKNKIQSARELFTPHSSC